MRTTELSRGLIWLALCAALAGGTPVSLADSIDNICVDQPQDTRFNNPASCRSFWICWQDMAVAAYCADTEHFNPVTLECVDAAEFECDDEAFASTTEGATLATTEAASSTEASTSTEMSVTTTETWSTEAAASTDASTTSKTSSDGESTTEAASTTEEPQLSAIACVDQPNGYFVNDPRSCSAYFWCHNGVATEQTCADRLPFNQAAQLCDWQFECNDDEGARNPCAGQFNGYFVNDPRSCSAYFWCHNEVASEQTCLNGLAFNQAEQMCDWQLECVETPTTTEQQSTTVESIADAMADNPCAGQRNGYFVNDPRSCPAYFWCHNEVATEQVCHDELSFNQEAQLCDWQFECNEPTTTTAASTTVASTTVALASPAERCAQFSDGWFINNPARCTAYYVCWRGAALERDCDNQLAFNEAEQLCDWKLDCVDPVLTTTTESTTDSSATPTESTPSDSTTVISEDSTTVGSTSEFPTTPQAPTTLKESTPSDSTTITTEDSTTAEATTVEAPTTSQTPTESTPSDSTTVSSDDSTTAESTTEAPTTPQVPTTLAESTPSDSTTVTSEDSTSAESTTVEAPTTPQAPTTLAESTPSDSTTVTSEDSTTAESTTVEAPTTPQAPTIPTESTPSDSTTVTIEDSTTAESTTVEAPTTPQAPTIVCPPTGIHQYAMPGSCVSYYFCYAGVLEVRQCVAGLHFDAERGGCNFIEQAACTRDLCPAVDDPNNLKFFPSRLDCGKYYVCYRGDLQQKSCLPGLWWNAEIGDCDDPANVDCDIIAATTETASTDEA